MILYSPERDKVKVAPLDILFFRVWLGWGTLIGLQATRKLRAQASEDSVPLDTTARFTMRSIFFVDCDSPDLEVR